MDMDKDKDMIGDLPAERMNHPPPPPPFNPVQAASTSNNTHAAASVSNSVVPDLMRVYESLTQSSTPQNPLPDGRSQEQQVPQAEQYTTTMYNTNNNASPSDFHQSTEQQAGFPGGDTTFTYDTTSVPIPPIPESAYTAGISMQLNPDPSTITSVQQPDASSNQGRGLRKRSAANTSQDDSSVSENESARGSARGTKKRKKNGDGRWSKRFTWPVELHKDFTSAIFDVGLKHSSPSTILEQMPKHEQITSERIKSHLQKYRVHREKSKREFMSSYEATVSKLQKEGMGRIKSLSSGEVAGQLTYASMMEGKITDPRSIPKETVEDGASANKKTAGLDGEVAMAKKSASAQHHDTLILPRLTEQEKQSPIGASMGYLMGLFFSLKQQLMAQRAAQQAAASAAAKKNQPVAAVYDSFVTGQPPIQSPFVTSSSTKDGPVVAAPSTRSNLEESNIMKREMASQMAFQNKMRALKQQELSKYTTTAGGVEESSRLMEASRDEAKPTELPTEQQGAGETVADGVDNRNRDMTIGAVDDFWNSDVVDDQLFEFLMNS